ncbi:hypothetical protein C1N59_23200 (plasmid) [Pantoea sp. SGAir0183]
MAHYFIVGYLLFPKLGICFLTVEVPSGCFQAEISSKFVIVKTPCGLTNCEGVFVGLLNVKLSFAKFYVIGIQRYVQFYISIEVIQCGLIGNSNKHVY